MEESSQLPTRKKTNARTHVSSIFSFWNTMEKDLSPVEKKVEKKFFLQVGIIAVFIFLSSTSAAYLQEIDQDFWPEVEMEPIVSDTFSLATEGFFGKTNIPTLSNVNRSEVSEIITYEVQPGDSLFLIASKFGIRTRTLKENNDIPSSNILKTGMELKILPVDGILYTVKSGDTLSEISKKYDTSIETIKKQNGFKGDNSLIAGKDIILPGAREIKVIYTPPPKIVASTTNQKKPAKVSVSIPSYTKPPITSIVAKPSPGKKFVWPVQGHGQVTQGYRSGHYAIDIWGSNRPNILAVKDGTVEIAAGGCKVGYKRCHYGYGNYIVINHGGGLKTLYAHNTVFYVKKGQKVKAGQIIAKMGNTGNVRGRTGIHLHFEVHLAGKKMNPMRYL